MKVSRKEFVNIRKSLLKQMDNYIKENVDEEICISLWFATGLEDGWDDEILTEYASDDELWNDCIKTFDKCVNLNKIF